MSSVMYKQGQGYWTRLMSAVGFGLLVFAAALWAWEQLETIDLRGERIYWQGGAAGLVMLVGGALVYYFIYMRRSSSEFLIATEGEMKKVNWSSRREVLGSTWVVIAISVMIASVLLVVDLGLSWVFKAVGVLDQG